MDEGTKKQEPKIELGQGNSPVETAVPTDKKRRPRVSRVLMYGGVFGFFASWAGIVGSIGRPFLIFAASLMLFGSASLALGIRLELRNHHWKKWKYNSVASGIIIVAAVLASLVLAAVRQNQSTLVRKNFRFGFDLFERTQIELTNDFLICTNFEKTDQIHGALVIPVARSQSEATLHFGVINDSTTAAEDVYVRIAFLKGMVRASDFGWRPFRSHSYWTSSFGSGQIITNEIEEFGFPLEETLLSGNSSDLPPVAITLAPTDAQAWPIISLMARAKDFPTVSVGFAIFLYKVPPGASPNKPVVVFIKSVSSLSLGPRELTQLIK